MALSQMLRLNLTRNFALITKKVLVFKVENQVAREMRLWQLKTLKLMWHRKRLMDAVEPRPDIRSEYQEWNYKSELFAFNQRLKEKFSEESLMEAFTHKSYIEKDEQQRKELGLVDVVLNLKENSVLCDEGQKVMTFCIKSYLRKFLPRVPEEGIRAFNDYLLSDDVLADIGNWIGCKELILCAEYPPSLSTTAITVKALVGALSNECGVEHTKKFILDFIISYLADKDLMEFWEIENPNEVLNSILFREHLPAAEPRLLQESAKETLEACYIVGLYVNKQLIGSAPGETISIAKEMAALDCLRNMFGLIPGEVKFAFGENGYKIDLNESRQEHMYLKEFTPTLLKNSKFNLEKLFCEKLK